MQTDGKLLRLKCPACGAEFPLWFRAEDPDDTLTPAEWERWMETPCKECGARPRDFSPVKPRTPPEK